MRLDDKIKLFFKQSIDKNIQGSKLYLFGSRANNEALGGDIDLMILTNEPINKTIFRAIRMEFYKQFGWQKIDLINFTFSDNSAFKQLIITNAIEL